MKKLITLLLAQLFNWFKIKSPVAAAAVLSVLAWAQAQLADPAVMQEITEALDGAPKLLIKIITWLPTILLGLIAPHTKETIDEHRATRRARRKAEARL